MTLEFRSASRFTRNVFDICPIIWTANKKGERRMKAAPEVNKPVIEETLQSIDGTLKRIEELLSKENCIEIFAEEITNRLADSLEKAMPRT